MFVWHLFRLLTLGEFASKRAFKGDGHLFGLDFPVIVKPCDSQCEHSP